MGTLCHGKYAYDATITVQCTTNSHESSASNGREVVCPATTERLPSGHRANLLGSRSVAARRALVGISGVYCGILARQAILNPGSKSLGVTYFEQ